MGFLTRLLGSERGETPGQDGSAAATGQLVPDWPVAAPRPAMAPDRDSGFDTADAPPSAVGVLQWTSGLLIDGGTGDGGWDFIDLAGWDAGDMSEVISDLGVRETELVELTNAVGDALGYPVNLVADTWAFSPNKSKHSWTAPLFVVHRRA